MTDERPVGSPTLDRRIERLEREFATFLTDVALMKAEQTHLRELVTAKFGETATSMGRIEGTLVGMQASIATATASITTASTDPAASPLGRALTQDIQVVAQTANDAKRIAEGVDRRFLLATGAIGVIAWVAGIVGPIIAGSVFGQ